MVKIVLGETEIKRQKRRGPSSKLYLKKTQKEIKKKPPNC